jgi:hypothetical protein
LKRYLISGMPRCRTAWLTALLHAHGSRPVHDVYLRHGSIYNVRRPIIDPAVALIQPMQGLRHFQNKPIVGIYSDNVEERIERLLEVMNLPGDDDKIEMMRRNYQTWYKNVGTHYHVDALEDNQTVADIILKCTGHPGNLDVIETFQLLKIEEHIPKALALAEQE